MVSLAMAIPNMSLAAGPSSSPTSKLHWRNVGPTIGGRVVAIAGVPDHPNVFYFGGVDSGVWQSTDYGQTWNNLSDSTIPSPSIGALAVAPSNDNILYAGTGESDIRGTMITGDGIYRSNDAGKTWQYAGLRETHTTSALAIDPKNPDVVYASSMGHVFKGNTERGVYKTTDGGKTWHKILYVNADTGAIDLVMDAKHPNVLYAAMWQAYRTPWRLESGGAGSGLYKTTDGGAHWTKISHAPGFASGVLGRIGVSLSASDPNIVYAIVQAKDGGVFRSTDAGKSWTRVNAEMKLRQRAFYYTAIYVDPTNPNTVYAPNVDACWVSRDGGKLWAKLRPPHGDNHIVWINPHHPNILLEGNDGGASVSLDGGKTWSNEHNQPTGQFYHISIDDRFPFHIYGAQQDEGSIEGPSSTIGGSVSFGDWHRVAYGESTFVAPQPGDPNVTYGSGYYSILMRYDLRTGQYQDVSPWPRYQEGAASNELRYRMGWTHPVFFGSDKELLVGSQYVLRSDDYGQTWKELSPDLTRNDPKTELPSGGPIDVDASSAEVFPDISSLAVSSLDNGIIWAGSADGLVHVSTDDGASWKAVTPPALPQWCQISSIEPSHTDKATAYVTASRYMWDDFHPYIYVTHDYGAHWSAITQGIPQDEYVFVVRQDPKDANLLFAGTKYSVYVSYDGGGHWQSLALNLPHVQVRDIAISTREGAVAIATHGRAFWVLDNLALLEQAASDPANTAHVFAPQSAWLTRAYGANPFARDRVGENAPFGTTVFFQLPSSYDGRTPVSLTFADAKGNIVRTFTLHRKRNERKLTPLEIDQLTPAQVRARALEELTSAQPGTNRFQWDMRYPPATEVTGFQVPVAAGGLEDEVWGPSIVPGRYTVTLDYGGSKTSQPFDVALDPTIHSPTADDLAARLDLGMKIHTTLDALDRTINDAMATRDRVRSTNPKAAAALDAQINTLVQTQMDASEAPLLHETHLRSHLAYLAGDIELAYEKPTPAQYAVFEQLQKEASAGEERLRQLIAQAK